MTNPRIEFSEVLCTPFLHVDILWQKNIKFVSYTCLKKEGGFKE